MLRSLEAFLAPAIDAALPGAVSVVTGAYDPSDNGDVVIHARSLGVEPPPRDSEGDDGAHLIEIATWTTDGNVQDLVIPPAQTGELLDVEAPPGKLATAGDDYFVDDRTIRFYRPPAAGTPGVRARLRGPDAAGWSRRRRCTIELDISSWARDMDDADDRLDIAMQVALSQLVDIPILEVGQAGGTEVWLRVISPRVWLTGMRREFDESANLCVAHAEIELRGELDVLVASGAPAPVGIIEEVVIQPQAHTSR